MHMTAANVAMDRHVVSRGLWEDDAIVVPPTDHDLTVIIPAFNEERRLPWTLAALTGFLTDWDVDHRVLVVDDGSTDRTAMFTDIFGPRFSTIRLGRQGGKGRAVRTAMLCATGHVVAFTDADLPFDLKALRQGYDWIRRGQCEVVFGARDMKESTHLAPRRLSRQIATFLFREVARCLISRQVTDTQCGLKLFSRRAALEIFSRLTIEGFAFDAEVVLLTQQLGLTFRRVPVTLVNDYGSTLSLRRNALPMLLDVLRLRWKSWFGPRPPAPQFRWEGWDGLFAEDRRRLAA
jgi:dolichyl-phosphate beta-glucosyltransferase